MGFRTEISTKDFLLGVAEDNVCCIDSRRLIDMIPVSLEYYQVTHSDFLARAFPDKN